MRKLHRICLLIAFICSCDRGRKGSVFPGSMPDQYYHSPPGGQ